MERAVGAAPMRFASAGAGARLRSVHRPRSEG